MLRSLADQRVTATSMSTKEIASLLILFKRRHKLSIQCISDLLPLLSVLGVTNAPRSWYQLKCALSSTTPSYCHLFPCSDCLSASTSSSCCSNCGHQLPPDIHASNFFTFSIETQLKMILHNTSINLVSSSSNNTIRDIQDGCVYQRLKQSCSDQFVTLTMNIDGVEIRKGSNKSIWPVLLVVNEVPFKQRYALENTIIAGLWSGSHKPSRSQMKCFLSSVVEELCLLEQGFWFVNYRKPFNQQEHKIKVFLIAACCDKPAQALVQNLPEPIAAFGCGRCETEGAVRQSFSNLENSKYLN